MLKCRGLVLSSGIGDGARVLVKRHTVSTAAKPGIRRNDPLREEPSVPVLLTADEMADLLRTSRTAIYAMVARGQLPGVVRVGRRVLFRRVDVMRWLAEL